MKKLDLKKLEKNKLKLDRVYLNLFRLDVLSDCQCEELGKILSLLYEARKLYEILIKKEMKNEKDKN